MGTVAGTIHTDAPKRTRGPRKTLAEQLAALDVKIRLAALRMNAANAKWDRLVAKRQQMIAEAKAVAESAQP